MPDRPKGVRFPVMFQGWTRISFLHWPYDPTTLQPYLPSGLAVDTFERTGWVGLTPFHLTGLRPPFPPVIPGLSNFPETNLRTYVLGPAGPGIWFFSLDAASRLTVVGTRLVYRLPYHWATMAVTMAGTRIQYTSARAMDGATTKISVEVGEPVSESDDRGRFLTERYRLYTSYRGSLAVCEVEHPPWRLFRGTLVDSAETIRRAAGLPDDAGPPLVHYSPGVHVRVGGLRRLKQSGQADVSA